MKHWFFLLLLSFVLPGLPVAEASMRSARQARQMLGPEIWARTLRIENTNSRSLYPAVVYATVFEFDSLLWFYTETDGTQSLSRQLGRLEEDKVDLLPLLQRIDPGFVAYEALPEEGVRFIGAPRRLLNGCFIDSVAALRTAFDAGVPITEASLLTYYMEINGRRLGHTVLIYTTDVGVFVIDRSRSRKPRALTVDGAGRVALVTAHAVQGNFLAESIVRARWVHAGLPATRLAPAYAEAAAKPGPDAG